MPPLPRFTPTADLRRHAVAHAAALLLMGGTLAPVAPAQAQQGLQAAAARSLDIPPGPLAETLNRYASAAGVALTFSAAQTEGKQSPGVRGRHGMTEGFARVLAGSGLEAVETGPGRYALVQRPQPISATTQDAALPAVTVSGKALGSTTEGTGSYTTFSTSSSTRLNLTQQETPQAVTVLTRQRMDDQKLDSVMDALDATAGVIVQGQTVGENGFSAYARGSELRNYQIDGVPVFNSLYPYQANTAAFDRIEIVRGATGILNGLGTPAATVNMIRKRPTAEPQVTLAAEVGSWNRHGVGLDASGALNEDKSLRGRLVADYKHRNAWVDRFRQKDVALYGIGELDLGRDTLLTAGFSHQTQNNNAPIQARPLYYNNGAPNPVMPADNMTQRWRYYDQETSSVFTSIEHRLSRTWVAKAEYSHTRYHYDGLTGTVWAPNDASGDGSRLYSSHWDNIPRQNNLDAYVSGAFPLFGRTHELIAGVTLSRLKTHSLSYVRDPGDSIDINYHDWADAPEPRFQLTGTSDSREQQDNAFMSTRLSVTDATNLLLGGRWTRWQSTSSTREQKERLFVPYVGAVHAFNDTWSVYGSYTKIFRPQTGTVLLYGGTDIPPEEGTGYEVGVKASFLDGRFTSNLALFQTELKNLAIWNLVDRRYEAAEGLTKTRGAELELSGELAKNWQLTAGYMLSQSKDGMGKRLLTYVPRQNMKLFTSYRMPGEWSKLTLGGGVHWQSAVHSGQAIDHRQGSVALLNLMARYEVDKNLSVALNLSNALNKQYFSSIGANYGIYGAPRSVAASLKYRF